MKIGRAKFLVAALTVGAAATILAMAGMSKDWVYFLPVDDFVAAGEFNGQRVRLHGVVGQDNVVVRPAELVASFDLVGETSSLHVNYNGIVPDQFQPAREVVVEGTVGADGVMQADTLMTKCSSKYESDGEAPHADPRSKEPDA